jgi:hypothetical protein
MEPTWWIVMGALEYLAAIAKAGSQEKGFSRNDGGHSGKYELRSRSDGDHSRKDVSQSGKEGGQDGGHNNGRPGTNKNRN